MTVTATTSTPGIEETLIALDREGERAREKFMLARDGGSPQAGAPANGAGYAAARLAHRAEVGKVALGDLRRGREQGLNLIGNWLRRTTAWGKDPSLFDTFDVTERQHAALTLAWGMCQNAHEARLVLLGKDSAHDPSFDLHAHVEALRAALAEDRAALSAPVGAGEVATLVQRAEQVASGTLALDLAQQMLADPEAGMRTLRGWLCLPAESRRTPQTYVHPPKTEADVRERRAAITFITGAGSFFTDEQCRWLVQGDR